MTYSVGTLHQKTLHLQAQPSVSERLRPATNVSFFCITILIRLYLFKSIAYKELNCCDIFGLPNSMYLSKSSLFYGRVPTLTLVFPYPDLIEIPMRLH